MQRQAELIARSAHSGLTVWIPKNTYAPGDAQLIATPPDRFNSRLELRGCEICAMDFGSGLQPAELSLPPLVDFDSAPYPVRLLWGSLLSSPKSLSDLSPHPTSSVLSISPAFAPCLDVQRRIARERVATRAVRDPAFKLGSKCRIGIDYNMTILNFDSNGGLKLFETLPREKRKDVKR